MVQEDVKTEIERMLLAPIGAEYDHVDGYERVYVHGYTDSWQIVISRDKVRKTGIVSVRKMDLLEFHWFYEPATCETAT